jgi:hypothetical protein
MTIRAVTLLAGASVLAYATATAGAVTTTPRAYSQAVVRVCAGALLFDGSHAIGTRVGAIAVSQDIRRTGSRRLRRVDAIPKPPSEATVAESWIAVERQLVEFYAATYLRVWYAIERATTPRQRAALPGELQALINLARPLEHTAWQFEQRLSVPDCTGGIPPSGPMG